MTDEKEVTEQEMNDIFNSVMAGADTPAPKEVTPEVIPEAPSSTDEPATPTDEVKSEQPEYNLPPELEWVKTVEDKELREKILGLEQARHFAKHQFDANNGRINAYQRKIEELGKQLSQRAGMTAPPVEQLPTPATPEEWERLLEADPIAAKAVEARVKQEVERLESSLKGEMKELQQSATNQYTQQYMQTEAAALDVIAPAWRQAKDSPQFQGWLQHEASPELRELAMNGISRTDVMTVLNTFASEMIATGRAGQAAPANRAEQVTQPQQVQTQAPVLDTTKADQIQANRDRKLESTSGNIKAPPAPSGKHNPTGPVTEEEMKKIFDRTMAGENALG